MCQKRHWYFLLWTLSLSIVNFKCPPPPKKKKKEKKNLGCLLEVFWDSCLNMKVTPLVILHGGFFDNFEMNLTHFIRLDQKKATWANCTKAVLCFIQPCESLVPSLAKQVLFPITSFLVVDLRINWGQTCSTRTHMCVCVRVCGLKAKEDN